MFVTNINISKTFRRCSSIVVRNGHKCNEVPASSTFPPEFVLKKKHTFTNVLKKMRQHHVQPAFLARKQIYSIGLSCAWFIKQLLNSRVQENHAELNYYMQMSSIKLHCEGTRCTAVFPKVRVAIQTRVTKGQKLGHAQAIQPCVAYFQRSFFPLFYFFQSVIIHKHCTKRAGTDTELGNLVPKIIDTIILFSCKIGCFRLGSRDVHHTQI